LFGVESVQDLRRIGLGENEKFTERLTAKGVPDAVCDCLFKEYVEGTSSSYSLSSSVKKARAVDDVVNEVFSDF